MNMELTIDQALQKAVEAHKAGKLQDAESLYRAILQAQPNHPDANHNLGVLAVSVNKSEAALPLFKTALEANPNQGQFWLSYVDTLIKAKQFEDAKNLLEQGKRQGLAGERVDELEVKLTASLLAQSFEASANKTSTFTQQRKKVSTKKEKKKNSSSNQTNLNQARNPSQVELNALLEHYQKERFDLAENLAKTITQKYPDHQFGWKVIGALYQHTGRLQKSLIANQRAVEISPNDAEAHYNLGNTLKVIGRIEDAETSYKKAIAIKPEYAEAHSNLGITLQTLGRLEDAKTSYKKAIAIKPDLAEAHYNLGNTLKDLGRLEDAETSYKKAIAIKPEYAEAHSNLGNTLNELGRLKDAAVSYNKAIAIKPEFAEAHSNLGNTLKDLGRLEDAETSYKKAIAFKPEFAEAHYNLGNTLQEFGRLADAEASYSKAIAIESEYPEAHSNLGLTLQELGRLEDAEASYNKAIAIKPEYAEAHSNLGLTLQELGRLEDARASYNKAIVIKPDLAEAHSNLGLLLMQTGDLEGSRNMHERAIKLDSKKWNIYYNYSTFLYEIGYTDAAIDSMKCAQFIAPKNKIKLVEICLKAISAAKNATKAKVEETYQASTNLEFGLRSDPLILSRPVEHELSAHLCQMNSRILDKTIDARYGNGKCSTDFELFNDNSKIIKVIAQDLTKICRDAVASEVYICDSFFNIYGAGAGTKIHNHITSNDKFFDLSNRKYSLVYYLDVGDQSGLEPGVLSLFDPDQGIMPLNGMIVIINANKKHRALYDGKADRIMIGVNFYSV
jgi:tetratricopeptide (TPR) repeat protein